LKRFLIQLAEFEHSLNIQINEVDTMKEDLRQPENVGWLRLLLWPLWSLQLLRLDHLQHLEQLRRRCLHSGDHDQKSLWVDQLQRNQPELSGSFVTPAESWAWLEILVISGFLEDLVTVHRTQ